MLTVSWAEADTFDVYNYLKTELVKQGIPADQIAFVEKAITEGTNGRAKMKKEKDLYYSVIDGEVKVFTD